MDENSGDIDWGQLPKDQRIDLTKDLFKAVSGVADLNRITISELIDQAFAGLPAVGTDYQSNFRRGNISAAKAKMMHRWLEENYFDLAQEFAPVGIPQKQNPQSQHLTPCAHHGTTGFDGFSQVMSVT